MLSSVAQTALSAISGAELAIQVSANNMANAGTNGFKASRPVFSTSFSQTLRTGQAPTATSGGSNPAQIGTGVQLATIDTDFTQGSISLSGNPLDLALEGPGFFALQSPLGEQRFTRDGGFHLNANNELVSADGSHVLGYNVDQNHQLVTTSREPVQVPTGPAPSGASLSSLSVSEDGTIQGLYTDGVRRDLGQIDVAQVANPQGLEQHAGTQFSEGANSGPPAHGNTRGSRVISGAREMSNTDIGRELINMQLSSTMFRANLQVLRTSDAMMEELLNLRRSR